MSGSEAIYIDSSLLVALIAPESARHRQAVEWAGQSPALVTSVLAEVEVLRALRRREAPRPVISVARRLLGRIEQVQVTDEIRAGASEVRPASVRSLDAIHIATALEAGVSGFASLDARQLVAAEEMGLALVKFDLAELSTRSVSLGGSLMGDLDDVSEALEIADEPGPPSS